MTLQALINDGANNQAQATLCYLSTFVDDLPNNRDYLIEVNRFHNCREQGYTVTLTIYGQSKQKHIAFFEHRNSDHISCIEFETGLLINPPTVDDAVEGGAWKNGKYDTNADFSYGECAIAAAWIAKRINSHVDEAERAKAA